MFRKKLILIFTVLTMALLPVSALAGTSGPVNGITLNFPDNMVSCNPTFNFSTTGVEEGWGVKYDIFKSVSGSLVRIGGGETTGNLDISFTPESLSAGQSQVYAIFIAVWNGPVDLTKPALAKLAGKWRVDCEKPPSGGEGCTPGFWKNHEDVWPIPTGTDFDATFGRDAFDPNITMLQAVELKGGGLNALSRHAAAAYLNAVDSVVNFDLTAAEVVAAFQAAFDSGDFTTTKNMFEELNELGCPY